MLSKVSKKSRKEVGNASTNLNKSHKEISKVLSKISNRTDKRVFGDAAHSIRLIFWREDNGFMTLAHPPSQPSSPMAAPLCRLPLLSIGNFLPHLHIHHHNPLLRWLPPPFVKLR
ncbi:Uncharacterized protein TCM_014782 [Theobroma cacao]|uniref:Uncharacterized protein n=1 Tax=Theobroma cacao TaxID=3641 RepID=A0A061FZP2_THECC|nr:Uncharacterized protein TCM_014782 [Theobroma cacao]